MMRMSMVAEIDATEYFETEGIDWQFCITNAHFVHMEACEFILHVGPDGLNDDSFKGNIAKMKEFGCTPGFIQDYEYAASIGAERVLFYA